MKIFIGVDLHKHQFTCFMKTEDEEMGFSKYLTNEAGYQAFFKETEAFKALGYQVLAAVESTGNTRYFKKRLEEKDIEVRIINTLKFKVVNESVKKTDKHDAKVITEFLAKDMLPESKLCSERSEQLRRLLNSRKVLVKSKVSLKNQVHGILLGYGIDSKKGQLNSRIGRSKLITTLKQQDLHLVVECLIESIERIESDIKKIEKLMDDLTVQDRQVEIIKSIPGAGRITAITVRAFIDDVSRFKTYKQFSAYAGLVPWVQCSDKTQHYGRITKRGPTELRTALVQIVLGMVKVKSASENIIMIRYRQNKIRKGSGKSIIAAARKMSKLIWYLLQNDCFYDSNIACDLQAKSMAESQSQKALDAAA